MSGRMLTLPYIGGPEHGRVDRLADPVPREMRVFTALTPIGGPLVGDLSYRVDGEALYRLRRWGEGDEMRYYYEYECEGEGVA